MASLDGFNASEVDPSQARELVTPGWYTAVIMDSNMKPTKKLSGEYLELQFEIVDEGQFKGAYQWARLNLVNENEKAVEIAQRDLSAICRAVGVMEPKDSGELHMRPLKIKVAIEPRSDTGENSNVVKGFKSAVDAAPVVNAAKPPALSQVQEPATKPANGGGAVKRNPFAKTK